MERYDDTASVNIQLRWNQNALKGFGVALIVGIVLLCLSTCVRIVVDVPADPLRGKELTPIIFGEGDGTGIVSGNLTPKGAAARGTEAKNPLEDAQKELQTEKGKVPPTDPSQSNRLVASNAVGTSGKDNSQTATGDQSVGKKNGTDNGTGLDMAGLGSGRGTGLSDIDWGGGGNRTVLTKVLPKKPPGSLDTEVRMRFKVLPDGSVSWVTPVRRGGDPAVNEAAKQALMRWRFNPLANGQVMEGIITIGFRNS